MSAAGPWICTKHHSHMKLPSGRLPCVKTCTSIALAHGDAIEVQKAHQMEERISDTHVTLSIPYVVMSLLTFGTIAGVQILGQRNTDFLRTWMAKLVGLKDKLWHC